MEIREEEFKKDISAIEAMPIVSTILNIICHTTGMGFAAIARVTSDRWITCSVRDDINFGLKPGDELEVKTTICDEIRESKKKVVINHVSENLDFKYHHTPAKYGFQSYISVPIIKKNGSFFGTLCAIDPNPNVLDTPTVIGMFELYADLISFHLNAIEDARLNETILSEERAFNNELEDLVKKRTGELKEYNISFEKMNKDLQAFAFISSHDLQEPLRKIQTIVSIINEKESKNLSKKGKDYFGRIQKAAERMQSLINDLLAYSRTTIVQNNFEETDLIKIVNDVKDDFSDDLKNSGGVISVTEMCRANVIPFQFRQLLYNLVSNSIKFSSDKRPLIITIEGHIENSNTIPLKKIKPDTQYCHIIFSDNGIGFSSKFNERIFELFQQLNDKVKYAGTGIGLAIVKRIVENHNGFITAYGEPDKGSTFDIYIPLKQSQ